MVACEKGATHMHKNFLYGTNVNQTYMILWGNCCLPEKIYLAENVSITEETRSLIERFPTVTTTQAVDMPQFAQCLKKIFVSNVLIATTTLWIKTIFCTCEDKN